MELRLLRVASRDDVAYQEIMMPLYLTLADRYDVCLRVGVASTGADDEMAGFKAQGHPVFRRLDEAPEARRS
jgi:hypothetical protein